ncbi:MAG: DUF559 domain-containing protein [Dermatophilaceae bacterium]
MAQETFRPWRGASPPPGITGWDLRSGRFRRLFRGVYVDREAALSARLLALGALVLAPPGAAASHHTAARIWGGVVPDAPDTHIVSPGPRTRVDGIASHRINARHQVVVFRGVRLTVPTQTFLDLATVLDLVELVVLGDSLVAAGRLTTAELIRASQKYDGSGCRRARRAAGLVRPGVDSPMESRLRMLLVLAGLPEPVVNYCIEDRFGEVLYRFDLSYPAFRLIIEYDGRQHAESDVQWAKDIGRREWIDSNDWRIVVHVAKDVYRTPGRTLRRVTVAMRDRGMTVPRLSEEWRRFFPSRPEDVAEPI